MGKTESKKLFSSPLAVICSFPSRQRVIMEHPGELQAPGFFIGANPKPITTKGV